LSQLTNEKFDQLSKSGTLTPFMTAKAIDEQVGTYNAKSEHLARHFTISFNQLDNAEVALAYDALLEVAKLYNFKLVPSKALNEQIENKKYELAA
jgi:hypothetical protein